MIVAPADARRIIARHYPGMPFRITTHCTLGVRSVAETACGRPTLAWRKLLPGVSAVRIGQLLPNGSINWDYEVQS